MKRWKENEKKKMTDGNNQACTSYSYRFVGVSAYIILVLEKLARRSLVILLLAV